MSCSQLPKALTVLATLSACTVAACKEPRWPDCENPGYENQAKQNICAGLRYESADRSLNKQYKITLGRLNDGQRQHLRADQRKWLRKLKPLCEESAGPREIAGNGRAMEYSDCLAQETEARTQVLRRWNDK